MFLVIFGCSTLLNTGYGINTLMRFSLLISIIQLYVVPNSCKSLLFLIRM